MMPPTSSSPGPQGSPRGTLYFHPYSFILGALLVTLIWGAAMLLFRRPDPPPIALYAPPTPGPTATLTPTVTPAPIVVYVSGAVHNPGLHTLSPQSRVGDAIVRAGGLTSDANPGSINQAELIWDGAQIHIPPQSPSIDLTLGSQPVAGLSGALPTPTPAGSQGTSAAAGAINVNNASASELESLPGIGASKAAAIIANRPYSSVDDLQRVPGIGEKTVEQLRPLVVTQ